MPDEFLRKFVKLKGILYWSRDNVFSVALVFAFCFSLFNGAWESDAVAKRKRQARSAQKRFRKKTVKLPPRNLFSNKNLSPLQNLKVAIQETLSGRWLAGGETAVVVSNAKTGNEILSFNPNLPLNPASNVKLVSTATALDGLDPSWRYKTSFYGDVPNKEGQLTGGVYLKGDWDPLFGMNNLKKMTVSLKERGVRHISGDLWMSGDTHRDLINTLLRVELRTPRSKKNAARLALSPPLDFVELMSNLTYKKRGRSKTNLVSSWTMNNGVRKLRLTIQGKAKRGRRYKYRKGFKDDPMVSAMMIKESLQKAGITLDGDVVFGTFEDYVNASEALPVQLATHSSKPVKELVALINKWSINWLADALIKTAARQKLGGEPSMKAAIALMQEWLNGIGVSKNKLLIDTGSGLSYNTKMTARQLVRVLRNAGGYKIDTEGEDHEIFMDSLAVGGVDGTLKKRFRTSSEEPFVFGKTGTLTKIIALSGVLKHEDGQDLIFSIVTNGTVHRHRNEVRKDHEYMVKMIRLFQTETQPNKELAME